MTNYNEKTIAAMYKFRGSHAWQGTPKQRQAKLQTLNKELAKANSIKIPKLKFQSIDGTDSGWSSHDPDRNEIVIRGRISVITYLHEFAHALLGYDEDAVRHWSLNLFKQIFPISFSKLVSCGNMYMKKENIKA